MSQPQHQDESKKSKKGDWLGGLNDDLAAKPRPSKSQESLGSVTQVVITSVDIPFWDIVALMVKWSLASIPAAIIMFLFFMAISALFGGVFAALFSAF
jgi:hypothetical protein